MNYIINRNLFEAIKDELSKPQLKRAVEVWGKSILDFEKAHPTDEIKQGKWKLSDEDSTEVINKMFNINLNSIVDSFQNNPFQEYYEFLKKSIDRSIYEGKDDEVLYESFDKFSVDSFDFFSLVAFQLNIFKIPNVKETLSDEVILRDENGRPIKDNEGKIQKVKKSEEEKNNIIFTNNCTDAFSLMDHYNSLIKDTDKKPIRNFKNDSFTNILSLYNDGTNGNFDLYPTREVYLYITHKSEDILNISVSKFYTSCQELYDGGGHGQSYMKGLIYNLFDPNTMPAFLIFNEPYIKNNGEKLVDFMPLARCLIRAIYTSNGVFKGLYFDKSYPGRMERIIHNLIKKYSDNNGDDSSFHGYGFNFDLPKDFTIEKDPYLDNLSQSYTNKIIGLNTKKLVIDGMDRLTISKHNNVKELVIKDEDFETNILEKLTKLEIITFQSMHLLNFEPFKDLKFKNIKISKCIVKDLFLEQLSKNDIHSLSIQSSEFTYGSLKHFSSLRKISFLYMPIVIDKSIFDNNKNLKEFEYTKDVYEINKEFIDSLKSLGIKTKQVGI